MNKYKCSLCSKSYQSEKDLERHLKRIHGLTIAKLKEQSDEAKSEFVNQCLEIMDKMDNVDH